MQHSLAQMPAFPSKLTVSSCYSYLPRQKDSANDIVKALKQDGFVPLNGESVRVTLRMAKTVLAKCNEFAFLRQCFFEDTIIIPVPGHAPRRDPDAVWPILRFAQEMASAVPVKVVPALERVSLVMKSATAPPGGRPDPQTHYESVKLHAAKIPSSAKAITLVDDVITRGSTFVGMYAVLREQFPDKPIHCFALVRALFSDHGGQFIDPAESEVAYENGKLSRSP